MAKLHLAQIEYLSQQLIDQVKAEHEKDFAEFDVRFDCYYSTHSEENRQLAEEIYQRLR